MNTTLRRCSTKTFLVHDIFGPSCLFVWLSLYPRVIYYSLLSPVPDVNYRFCLISNAVIPPLILGFHGGTPLCLHIVPLLHTMIRPDVTPDAPVDDQPTIGLIGMGAMGKLYANSLSAAGWKK
jgi:hypothetical protein